MSASEEATIWEPSKDVFSHHVEIPDFRAQAGKAGADSGDVFRAAEPVNEVLYTAGKTHAFFLPSGHICSPPFIVTKLTAKTKLMEKFFLHPPKSTASNPA
jgi:hypothetical protein